MQTSSYGEVERLELAWRDSHEPDWRDFLPADLANSPLTVLALIIETDIEQRIKSGRTAILSERYWEYPPLAATHRFVDSECVELVRSELRLRRRKDPQCNLDEYTAAFPDKAAVFERFLREPMPALSTSIDMVKKSVRPEPKPEPRPVVPNYEIFYEIGGGGMGIVWRARDLNLQRDVAIKILKKELVDNTDAVTRFRMEAQITGQLQHPGIPPVHEVGTLPDGRPYLVMKLIKGRSLAKLIEKDELDDELRAKIFEEVSQAVGYAHSRGVIHRDLKPANIMVGAFGEVQVMDWGLAKLLSSQPAVQTGNAFDTVINPGDRPDDRQTRVGSVVGTVAFMAPEQAMGEIGEMTERSDVFGLGAILCMMLTNEPPYVAVTYDATRSLARKAKLENAYQRLDDCGHDPAMVELCRRCLQPDPQSRPANGAELAAALATVRRERTRKAEQAMVAQAEAAVKLKEHLARRRVLMRLGAVLVFMMLIGFLAWFNTSRELNKANRELETLRNFNAGDPEKNAK